MANTALPRVRTGVSCSYAHSSTMMCAVQSAHSECMLLVVSSCNKRMFALTASVKQSALRKACLGDRQKYKKPVSARAL
jgi:hypothetical protein